MKETLYTVIHQMISFISIWKLNIIVHNLNQYAKIDIYFTDIDKCTAVISREIYVVNDL